MSFPGVATAPVSSNHFLIPNPYFIGESRIVYRRAADAGYERPLEGFEVIADHLAPGTTIYYDSIPSGSTPYEYMVVALDADDGESGPAITQTPATAVDARPIYENSFGGATLSGTLRRGTTAATGGTNGWTRNGVAAGTVLDETPVGSRRYLGQFVNDEVVLSLANVPSHEMVTVDFQLFIVNSWDGHGGTNGPDRWQFAVDGISQSNAFTNLLDTTFRANYGETTTADGGQAYPGDYTVGSALNPGGLGADESPNSLGYTDAATPAHPRDSVYNLHFTFRHTTSNLKVRFKAFGLQTAIVNGKRDESWGIDEVKISAGQNPSDLFITQPTQWVGAATGLLVSDSYDLGTISDFSAGAVVQANADYDEGNLDASGNPVDDRTPVTTNPTGPNWRLFNGHHIADGSLDDARDTELMHATLRLQQFGNAPGGRVRYGLTMPDDVKMWQWWPNGNRRSANAYRQVNAHWGLVIGSTYSRPVTPGQDIFYRIEGITEATLNQVKVYVFDASVENPPPLGVDDIPPGADGDPVQMFDTYSLKVQQADLDGDTDNTGSIGGDDAEELREERGGFVSVPVAPTTDDATVPPTNAAVYSPVRLSIDSSVDVGTMRFMLARDVRLSVWTPWTSSRNDADVRDGGNAVPNGVELSAAALGLSNSTRSVTLYVQASETLSDALQLYVDPDGNGTMTSAQWDVLPIRAGTPGPGDGFAVTAPDVVDEGSIAQVTITPDAGAAFASFWFDWNGDGTTDAGETSPFPTATIPAPSPRRWSNAAVRTACGPHPV